MRHNSIVGSGRPAGRRTASAVVGQGAALFFLDILSIFKASPEENNIFDFFLQILIALDERSPKTPDLRSTLTFVVL